MRLGLIGLGRIGAFHADTLSHLDGVDSLVVTDAMPAVTASVAERFGAEATESPAALISSGVDGIVIAAATDAHTALIKAGVDAGIPVFCEKPLSGVVAEAIAVVSNTRYNPRGYDVRLELHGTADSVVAGWTDNTPLRNLEADTSWPSGEPWTFFMDRLTDAFRAELTAFTEVVAGQRPSPCTVDDALAVTWIAEAATLSLQQHRPVRIDEVQK